MVIRLLSFVSCVFLLVASPAFGQGPIELPELPEPTVPLIPNCPKSLIGQINGVYYWITETCPPEEGILGMGASTTNYPVPCCHLVETEWVCDCAVTLVPRILASGIAADVCSMPEGTPEQIDAKLNAAISDCKERRRYYQKLINSPEIRDTPYGTKASLRIWKKSLDEYIAYLSDSTAGGDLPAVKISHFCKSFQPLDLEHRKGWSRSVSLPSNAPGIVLPDIQSAMPPAAASTVLMSAEPGVSVHTEGVFRVLAKDLQSGGQKFVFFKVFTFSKSLSTEVPLAYATVGVQVLDPGQGKWQAAKFVDRHQFSHMIEFTNSGGSSQVGLVTSWDDLMISTK